MNELIERYRKVRARTEALCAPLEIEDFCIQAMENASPPTSGSDYNWDWNTRFSTRNCC